MTTPLSPEAIAVLTAADKQPDRVILASGQLERTLYAEVDNTLTLLGGKWVSRLGAHIFLKPYLARLESILQGNEALPLRNPGAFFPTPDALAESVIRESTGLMQLPQGTRVIEPSAGRAALIKPLLALRPDLRIDACEIDPDNQAELERLNITVVAEDFLSLPDDPIYDAAILNPPFSISGDKLAWCTHIEKVRRVIKPDAIVVAILPEAVSWKSGRRIEAIREYFTQSGCIMANPEGSFVESGTATKTVTCYIGATATAAIAARARPLKPTSENVYWREATGPVFETENMFLTETGAVIYWMGQEAPEAQGWLRRKAIDTAAALAKRKQPAPRLRTAA